MDHIRQFDWCASFAPTPYFVDESALDNCSTEKIIMNKFTDPLISSDEEEQAPNVIDWDEVFKSSVNNRTPKLFVPGFRPIAPYPKVSTLTESQHYKGLRVLCAMYPNVLEEMSFHRPTVFDNKNFEMMKEIYEKEQKEYIEWAKTMWVSNHCVRALRPKPAVETVYEAEFKVRAHRLSGFPKRFDIAAQIPLECSKEYQYEIILKDTLVEVNVSDLPEVCIPKPITKANTIVAPCPVPEPCHKHPYQLILPNENCVSILPILEIHRELAQYAASNGTRFIASENALRCLVEFNRNWTIPITVCSAFNHEGERCNVVVLDSEFSINKEPATTRTYKAFRHLLEHSLIPPSEIEAAIQKSKSRKKSKKKSAPPKEKPQEETDLSSDEESLGLCIMEDFVCDQTRNPETDDILPSSITKQDELVGGNEDSPSENNKVTSKSDMSLDEVNDIIGIYNCTCSDTLFEIPPPRSFKKWQVTNKSTQDSIEFIVHCPHKARLSSTELLMEPIPEYQLELGASVQPPDRIRSLTLSLMLRKNASVLSVRVDGCNGDMVTTEVVPSAQWAAQAAAAQAQVVKVMHTTLSELQGLVPGHYVLQHEASHGANALLLAAGAGRLRAAAGALEAAALRAAPTLAPVLLPFHKFRKILPCAFTPFETHVVKDAKRPPAKQKTPPQAIRWPKRKKNKMKKF